MLLLKFVPSITLKLAESASGKLMQGGEAQGRGIRCASFKTSRKKELIYFPSHVNKKFN